MEMEQDRSETTPLIGSDTHHHTTSRRKHQNFSFGLIVGISITCLCFFFVSISTRTSKWSRYISRRKQSATTGDVVDIVPTLQSSTDLFSKSKSHSFSSSLRSNASRAGGSFEFLCVGDWGREGILPQQLVAESLAKTARPTSTIVSTGDNFYNHGVKTISDKRWSKSYEDVYGSLPELHGLDFLPVLGNHDHLGDPLAQVLYTDISPTWKLPSRYSAQYISSINGNNGNMRRILLVRLDTTPYAADKSGRKARRAGFVPDPQTLWLQHTLKLAADNGMYVLVIGHHNMYSGSTCGHSGTHHLRGALEDILVRYKRNILAYVCGHEHALMHLRKKGVDHIVSGGGSLLDPICAPKMHNVGHKYAKKMKHRGVLHKGNGAKFVKSANGFFKVEFDAEKLVFRASAINEQQEVLYSFEKSIQPLPR